MDKILELAPHLSPDDIIQRFIAVGELNNTFGVLSFERLNARQKLLLETHLKGTIAAFEVLCLTLIVFDLM